MLARSVSCLATTSGGGVPAQRLSPALWRASVPLPMMAAAGKTDRLRLRAVTGCQSSSIMSVASHLACGNLVWWVISGSSMPAEICEQDVESLRLPKNWHSYVRTAVLNVIGIVRIAMLAGREALIRNGDAKDARIHQLESEVAMLREELRINGARMQRVPSTATTTIHDG